MPKKTISDFDSVPTDDIRKVHAFLTDGSIGSFYRALIQAIARADQTNRARVGQGFPDLVAAWDCYMHVGETGLEKMLEERHRNR